MKIHSLQRRMEYDAALRKLNNTEGLGIVHRWLTGTLRGIAEVYIPYRLYKVTSHDNGAATIRYYAVDAAAGTLDPYEFVTAPEADAWTEVDTRNLHPVQLNQNQTQTLVVEKVRRLLYSRGFFRIANPTISAELTEPEFYVPYWAGFYGDEHNLSVTVLDAVRQTVEGNKLRRLVKTWLLQADSQNELKLTM